MDVRRIVCLVCVVCFARVVFFSVVGDCFFFQLAGAFCFMCLCVCVFFFLLVMVGLCFVSMGRCVLSLVSVCFVLAGACVFVFLGSLDFPSVCFGIGSFVCQRAPMSDVWAEGLQAEANAGKIQT